MTEQSPRVVIIGGGLAGLAAACHLADHGLEVVLVERRPYLGGRAFSFWHRRSEREVDNGQHVFLKCCTEYIHFLDRLGVSGKTFLQPRLRVPVVDPRRGVSILEGSPLPAPFHLLPSFLRFRHLSPADKARAAYAMLTIYFTDRTKRSDLDSISFYRWLKAHGQSEQAIDRFWNLIVVATLNDDARRVSADLALMVFQDGFLRRPDGANVGYARVPLTHLVAEAAARYIEERGGRIVLGQAAREILHEEDRVVGVHLSSGDILRGRFYVSALPAKQMLALLPPALRRHPFFQCADDLGTSPIVNIHLWYDRPVMDSPFAAFVGSEVQWVFNKSKMCPDLSRGPGQYVDISLSGAHQYIDQPNGVLAQRFIRELERLLPRAGHARLEGWLVVKQRHATFAAAPGSAKHRLPCRTPITNLFLAGDWTATGWPATMESAVRSGLACARDILRTDPMKKGGEEIDTCALAHVHPSGNHHPSFLPRAGRGARSEI
jgi:squalene-associated FAD-dependent desaturase